MNYQHGPQVPSGGQDAAEGFQFEASGRVPLAAVA
jgi:hypothetical protein